MIGYRTLNVRLQALGANRYEAIVQGPEGDGHSQFELSFDEGEQQQIQQAVSRPRSARRRIESDGSAHAREFGQRLFDTVFSGATRDVLRTSFAQAGREQQGVRLMFQLDSAPQLRNVPWELLWDKPRFMSTSAFTVVLRYVDLSARRPTLRVDPPLRILGMVSNPPGTPRLNFEAEQERLAEACHLLIDAGRLEIDWVGVPTLSALHEKLSEGKYHIFHFIGHGDFDETHDDGVLLFEGHSGRIQRVTGEELSTVLADHRTLRLAVINACEGARVATDAGGIASSMMAYGLPAVIAMQFEISDEAAISFARRFYSSLAGGEPVDEALGQARLGMFTDDCDLEWATPVLFTSALDGRLFDLGPLASLPDSGDQPEVKLKPVPPPPDGPPWGLIGGIAAALALGVTIVLLLLGGSSGSAGPQVKAAIPVDGSPVGVAVGGGRVWATDFNNGRVLAFDAHSHQRLGEMPVGENPNGVAVVSGQVWVLNTEKAHEHGSLVRFPADSSFATGSSPTGRPLPLGREPNSITVFHGQIWVANSKGPAGPTVQRINPGSASIGEPLLVGPPGTHLIGIAAGEGAVWAASSDGTISRIAGPTEVSALPGKLGFEPHGIAVGAGSLWVTHGRRFGSVRRLTLEGTAEDDIAVGDDPKGILATPAAIWVASFGSGDVSRIDPRTDKITGSVAVGKGANALAREGSRVWVTNVLEPQQVSLIEG